MKVKLSKNQWQAIGQKAGWIRTAIKPSLAPPAFKGPRGVPEKAPASAFNTPAQNQINPNPFAQQDSKTRKEVSDYVRWLGTKVNDQQLKQMITQDQGARKGVLEFTEALTNVPVAKSKEIVMKTEDVKQTLEEEQNKSVDDHGKPVPEAVGKKAKNNARIKLSQLNKEIYNPQLTTEDAKKLWFAVSDYMLMADDPRYETICTIKRKIEKLQDAHDREEMKKYFISEFGGSHTAKTGVWEYYK